MRTYISDMIDIPWYSTNHNTACARTRHDVRKRPDRKYLPRFPSSSMPTCQQRGTIYMTYDRCISILWHLSQREMPKPSQPWEIMRDHEGLQFFGSTSRWVPWKPLVIWLLLLVGIAGGSVASISAKGTIRLRRVSLVKTVDVSLAFLCQSGPMPCKLMAPTEEPRAKQNAPWQREACLLETLGERSSSSSSMSSCQNDWGYQIIMSPQYSSGINNGQANHNLCYK